MNAPVAVLASRLRADEKRILDAFDRRGVTYEYLDARTLWRTLQGPPERRWSVVLNREIGFARAAGAARMLEAAGVPVLNSAQAIEVCGDKYRTSVALHEAGLPTPRTALALTPEAALDALDEIGYPAVLKPLNGSWGRLVSRLTDRETAETVLEHVAALPSPAAHVIYVQEFIPTGDRDVRAVVVGGEVLGATYRRGAGWRTNVARGASTEPCPLTPELAKAAVAAARCVGADIAGVDLLEDGQGGWLVLEVNAGVEFSGFHRVHGESTSVADRIVDLTMARAEE
ncbi:RimK family alpha-L-glutamate ligase [Paractinoplanes toevensis]|uniref:Lysine biosynthesis enzyme LysX n=1 Tax=Paractinoplanes toevensis TaxID=571911 RepID=A0A919WB80_9ACTN|nr:RimK family alpha-L-glutamate ligase [Actinoplanes toevensis]GIM97024.1 lysine biosynthesis enzyme LysX [Actinoplanes toevensis]